MRLGPSSPASLEISAVRRTRLAVALSALVVALPACGGGGSDGPSDLVYAGLTPVEPTAGTWQTWIVPSVAAIRPAAPPTGFSTQTTQELVDLRARALARGPVQTANVDDWNAGACRRWNEFQLGLIVTRSTNPPKASRGLALVSVAMFDAMVSAYDTKYHYLRPRPSAFINPPATYGPIPDSPGYASDRAAISKAAAEVLKYLFPLDVAAINARLQTALDAELDSCACFQSDVDAGVAIGQAVATQVLAYAAGDHGDDPQPAYVASGIPGRWAPTPAAFAAPLLPGWGSVKTWLLSSGSAYRPGPCPPYNSAEWIAQRDEVLAVNLSLGANPQRAAIATFWADGGGTWTPPGHWNDIAMDLAITEGFNECRTTRMLALLNTAQADAFVACWDCKYHYDIERPISAIRRDVAGQATWVPYIATPPFPSYPSGHSSTSGAASQVLGYVFPASAVMLATMASEAKDSRLYGGIHYRFDNDTGLDLGRSIGTLAIERAATDGAP